MSKIGNCLIFFAIVYAVLVHCDYVTYVKMKNNKFEPALEPVSSTVEPIPIYKLGPKLYESADDSEEYYDKNTLLTVSNYRRERKQKHYDMDNHYVKVEPLN